jgi:hypothetical protein
VNLDDRLASAADAVRTSVRREPPSFDGVRARARRRRTVGAGVATVLVAVLAVFVLVPLADSGSNGRSVSVQPGDGPGAGGASCQPVVGHDGHTPVGCELASDANSSGERLAELVARFGGIPVYGDASAREQVGVVTTDLGFVPRDLVPRLEEVRACWPPVQAILGDPTAAPLDARCHELMTAMGYPESFLEGKGYGR